MFGGISCTYQSAKRTACFVDDVPKNFCKRISINRICVNEGDLIITYYMRGMMLYITIRQKTEYEIDLCEEEWIP